MERDALMRCGVAREELLEAVTGRIPPDRRQALLAHLATCAECRQLAGEFEETVGLLRAAPDPQPPEGFWPAFMLRVEAQTGSRPPLGTRLRRLLHTPAGLVPAAATAAAVLVFALSTTLLRPALPPVAPSPAAQVAPYVTDAVRSLLPHLDEALQIWESGLGAVEVEPLLEPPPPAP